MNTFLDEIIMAAITEDASDIYIQSEAPVFLRIDGRMTQFGKNGPEAYEIDDAIDRIFKVQGARAQLYDREEKDLSFTKQVGSGRDRKSFRFRVNVCLTKKGVSIVMRRLKEVNPDPAHLGIPAELTRLIVDGSAGGIIFIAGPTGSGKSTTLASIIAYLLKSRALNCVTIEDPIEYNIPDGLGNIIEREVGTTTLSFDRALRAAMRQRPDIILVGEVRDPETALAAIQAAKTGHLVFTTIHTLMATQVPSRIAAMFPPDKQNWIVRELADVLLGMMVQVLIRPGEESPQKGGLILATEFLEAKEADVREMIVSGRYDALRQEQRQGKTGWTLNQSLKSMVHQGIIDEPDARRATNDIALFMRE